MAVGTDDKAGGEGAPVGLDTVRLDGGSLPCDSAPHHSTNGGLPTEANAEFGGAIEQKLVEEFALHASAVAGRKSSLCGRGRGGIEKADAADAGEALGVAGGGGKADPEFAEGRQGVRHQALAAGFIDGRLHAVDDMNTKTLTGKSDGAGEAGGATARDEDVAVARTTLLVDCQYKERLPALYKVTR